jgi:hypothetical protein
MTRTARLQLKFDSSFVEEAVFLTVKGKGASDRFVKTFHRDRERMYQTQLPAQERDRQFMAFYETHFHELGLRQIFEQLILEFPRVCQPAILVFMKRVWSKQEEEVELYVQGELKTVYIGLQVTRICDREFLKKFLTHELTRVSDMLDPRFQYSPFPDLGGASEIEDNLVRERFRILWDIYIKGRLRKKGYSSEDSEEDQMSILKRGFPFWDEKRRGQISAQVRGGENFRQRDLLELATRGKCKNS